jgi:hypothetical protein
MSSGKHGPVLGYSFSQLFESVFSVEAGNRDHFAAKSRVQLGAAEEFPLKSKALNLGSNLENAQVKPRLSPNGPFMVNPLSTISSVNTSMYFWLNSTVIPRWEP